MEHLLQPQTCELDKRQEFRNDFQVDGLLASGEGRRLFEASGSSIRANRARLLSFPYFDRELGLTQLKPSVDIIYLDRNNILIAGKRVKKMWYVFTMEYYSAMKNN